MKTKLCPITKRKHCTMPECTDYPVAGNSWCRFHINEIEAEFGVKLAPPADANAPKGQKDRERSERYEPDVKARKGLK